MPPILLLLLLLLHLQAMAKALRRRWRPNL
jgi:ABC-type dipeptide/oligopeptide/nickel transport system permease subunit